MHGHMQTHRHTNTLVVSCSVSDLTLKYWSVVNLTRGELWQGPRTALHTAACLLDSPDASGLQSTGNNAQPHWAQVLTLPVTTCNHGLMVIQRCVYRLLSSVAINHISTMDLNTSTKSVGKSDTDNERGRMRVRDAQAVSGTAGIGPRQVCESTPRNRASAVLVHRQVALALRAKGREFC